MATATKFQKFAQDVGRKVHDLDADTLKIIALDAAPAATDTAYNDTNRTLTGSGAAEISGGNGYTQGGATVASTDYTHTTGTGKLIGNAVTWTASGGAIAQFRYLVLYNSSGGSAGARPILQFWDLGAEQNVASGNAFAFGKDTAGGNWDATTPLLTLT